MQAFRNLSTDATKLGFVFCEMFFRIHGEVFLCERLPVVYLSSEYFLNYGWLANAEKNPRRRLGKIRSSEGLKLSISRLLPMTCQLCTFDIQIVGVEMFPV